MPDYCIINSPGGTFEVGVVGDIGDGGTNTSPESDGCLSGLGGTSGSIIHAQTKN